MVGGSIGTYCVPLMSSERNPPLPSAAGVPPARGCRNSWVSVRQVTAPRKSALKETSLTEPTHPAPRLGGRSVRRVCS